MIPVTKTFFPPIEEYVKRLEGIWENGWVTNNGPLAKRLSEDLRAYLQVDNLELVANGTLALQLAIKALGLKGEVITTPYSYVATATSIAWEGCEPVFVDIEDRTFCIDVELIEAAITRRTTGIIATHVYGYPCDVKGIDDIARRHNLRVVYDAAHCFGIKHCGRSILEYGEVSTLSFHATKLFHTGEGGAVVCRDEAIAKRIGLMKRFGHHGEEDYVNIGINAKLSELHAAMGLCVLPHVDRLIALRRERAAVYDGFFGGTDLKRPVVPEGLEYNYGYYPVIFPSRASMMRVRSRLMEQGVYPRRYFHPSLNKLSYLAKWTRRECPVSESIAERVLALPMSHDVAIADLERIADIVNRACL